MSKDWWLNPFLAIDTETSGVDVFSDSTRIVEVAVVDVDVNGDTSNEWSTIVDCGVDIPVGAAAVHGITTGRSIAEGVPPVEALTVVAERIYAHWDLYRGNAAMVMFNAVFDWPLLLIEAERHDVEIPPFAAILDPLLIDRMLSKRKGKRNLGACCKQYGVTLSEEDAHGAFADATAAGRVMRKLIDAFPQICDRSLASLWLRQVRGHHVDRERFADWMRNNRDPDFEPDPPGWPVPAKPLPNLAVAG